MNHISWTCFSVVSTKIQACVPPFPCRPGQRLPSTSTEAVTGATQLAHSGSVQRNNWNARALLSCKRCRHSVAIRSPLVASLERTPANVRGCSLGAWSCHDSGRSGTTVLVIRAQTPTTRRWQSNSLSAKLGHRHVEVCVAVAPFIRFLRGNAGVCPL